jgi:hypothetical protein
MRLRWLEIYAEDGEEQFKSIVLAQEIMALLMEKFHSPGGICSKPANLGTLPGCIRLF